MSLNKTYEVLRLNWSGLGVVEFTKDKQRCVPLALPREVVQVHWHDIGWGRWIGERIDSAEDAFTLDQKMNCTQARRCTGCSLRHLDEKQQQEVQQHSHLSAIERLSGRDLTNLQVEWLKGAAQAEYRVRVTAKLWPHPSTETCRDEQALTWMLGLRSHWGNPSDLSLCVNHPLPLRQLVTELSTWINHHQQSLGLYDRDSTNPFALSRVSVQLGEQMPTWVILHFEDQEHKGSLKKIERIERLEKANSLLKHLDLTSFSYLQHNLSIYAQAQLKDQQRSSTPLIHIKGPEPQSWTCERGLSFVAKPPAWLPQTPSTLESLRTCVRRCLWGDEIMIDPSTKVFELGCGVGLLGIALAKDFKKITWFGVDIEEMSVACAQESAEINQVADRVHFAHQDGRRALAECASTTTKMVVHAMRKPLSGLLPLAAQRSIQKICYLAPSAPALGRDLAESPEYRLERIFLIDQMPGTAYVMTIAELTLIDI